MHQTPDSKIKSEDKREAKLPIFKTTTSILTPYKFNKIANHNNDAHTIPARPDKKAKSPSIISKLPFLPEQILILIKTMRLHMINRPSNPRYLSYV